MQMLALDNSGLFRSAGYSAVVGVVFLAAAAITIALFFGGAGEFWGPVNDVFDALMLLAIILPVLAVDRVAGPVAQPWLKIVTVAAVAGLTLGAVGQLLLVVGVIDLETSYITGGLGIIPFYAWLVALAILAFGPGVLPPSVGWLAIAVIVLTVVMGSIATVTVGPPLWVACVALLVALGAWLLTLGGALSGRAVT
jgi:hypothetical protein